MTVAQLKSTSPEHVTVVFDDGSELRSTLNVITDCRLYSGLELDEERLEELRVSSERALGFEYASGLLSRRQYSMKELHDRLVKKGLGEDIAAYCVRHMTENGLMDDGSYASAVARHYTAKGYGAGRIRSELSKRGVSRELWDESLEDIPANTDKVDRFIAVRLKDPDDPNQVRRVIAALQRRGFSYTEIREALSRFSAGADIEEEYI